MVRLPFRLPNFGPRTRKGLRIAGFIMLFLVTFVFALQWTFPFNRVKDKIIETLSAKYEVEISDVERGIFPGRVYFKAVTLRTRPTKADEVATTFYIERLQVDVGLFALLGSKASIDIDAKIAAGHITGNITLSKSMTSIHLDGNGVPAANLPMRLALGLPMSAGRVSFEFDLDLPNEKLKSGRAGPNWQKAVGGATFDCSNCTFGDGKSKLKPALKNNRNQAFAEGGIEFGKLNVEKMLAKVEIKRGTLKVTKFDAKSEDGKLFVDFAMQLQREIDDSTVDGCLRFDGSAELLKRDAKTHAALSTTGASKGPDGLFHIKLEGTIKQMRRLAKECGQGASSSDDGTPGSPSRPSITVQPVETPADAGGTPTFTPPPPPADAMEADAAVPVPIPHPEGEHNGPGSGSGAPPMPSGVGSNPVPEGMR